MGMALTGRLPEINFDSLTHLLWRLTTSGIVRGRIPRPRFVRDSSVVTSHDLTHLGRSEPPGSPSSHPLTHLGTVVAPRVRSTRPEDAIPHPYQYPPRSYRSSHPEDVSLPRSHNATHPEGVIYQPEPHPFPEPSPLPPRATPSSRSRHSSHPEDDISSPPGVIRPTSKTISPHPGVAPAPKPT